MSNEASYTTDFLNDLFDLGETLNKLKVNFTVPPEENYSKEDVEDGEFLMPNQPPQEVFLKKKPSVSRRSSVKPLKTISENSPTKKRFSLMPPPAETQQNKANRTRQTQNLKQTMIDWLTHQFSVYFERDYATQLPYCDFFCYSDTKTLKKRVYDVQRINVHDCLIHSAEYLHLGSLLDSSKRKESPKKRLKNSRRKSSPVAEVDLTSQNMLLPINIIYKLYLECGHMINLYDWLQVSNEI